MGARILTLILSLITPIAYSQGILPSVCGSYDQAGDTVPATWGDNALSYNGYLVGKPSTNEGALARQSIGCYGVVRSFQYTCIGRGSDGPVGFSVWRDLGGTLVMLGEYVETVGCTSDSTALETSDKHPWNQIPVIPGDILGIRDYNGANRIRTHRYTANECGTACTWYQLGSAQTATTAGRATIDNYRFSFHARVDAGLPPTIDNLPATIYVRETEPTTTQLYTVHTSDRNQYKSTWTTHGLTTYAGDVLVYGDFNAPGFNLDKTTGIITLTAALDYETAAVHYVSVVVHDGGTVAAPDGLSATATLTVSVVDVDEAHTALNLPQTTYIVAADYPVGTQIYQVAVTADNDGTLTGPYTYTIDTQTETGLFTIDSSTGVVSAAKDLTTETSTETHALAVSVWDGTFRLTQTLTIQIVDANTPPTLVNPTWTSSVFENDAGGRDVFDIEAIDNDGDTLTYTAQTFDPPSGQDIFSIASSTGIATMAANPGLNYETVTVYKVVFTVADTASHTATGTFTVNIQNVNEAPSFTTTYYEDTMDDSTTSWTFSNVAFAATDPEGNAIIYELDSGYGSANFFLDASYNLKTNTLVSYDNLWDYSFLLTVRVKDQFGLYGDTALVNITWVNKDGQHHVSNSAPAVTINCQDTVAGDTIFDVAALVTDKEVFDDFTYVLTTITPNNGYLELNPVTGIVSASRSFEDWIYSGNNQYVLSINIQDTTYTLFSQTVTLTITVTGYKTKPYFATGNMPKTVSIAETVGYNVDIYQVVAMDDDDDPIIDYTLTAYTPMDAVDQFVFDPSTGRLSTSARHTIKEDFASGDATYTFTVTATDAFHTSDSAVLTVNVVSVNEPPAFLVDAYEATVNEGTTSGTAVSMVAGATYQVTDPDGDAVTYIELAGPYSDYFDVRTDGTIVAGSTPTDCDLQQSTYMYLEIQVSDGTATDKARVNITVKCVNDRPVVFQQDVYNATIQENTYGGARVLAVAADDADYPVAEHAAVTYAIAGPAYVDDSTSLGDLYFDVDEVTGEIYVAHQVDFESVTFVEFEVTATDGVYTDTTIVRITVTDANDVQPLFVDNFQNFELPSYVPVGTVITQVQATDSDTGAGGMVTYFDLMAENYEYFSIDKATGVISVHQPLQPDVTYVLYVFATDQSDTPMMSTAAVIRIDSYTDWKFLLDIYTSLSVEEITAQKDDFLASLNTVVSPWFCRIQEIRAVTDGPEGTRFTRNLLQVQASSIVTVYGLKDNLADDQTYIDVHKSFVWRDQMLAKLRKNVYGEPTDAVSAALADFSVTQVQPTYPIWWVDTVEGLATVGATAAAVWLVLLVIMLVTLYCYRMCCFAYCDREPSEPNLKPVTPEPEDQAELFGFGYKAYDDDKTPQVAATPLPPKKENFDMFGLSYNTYGNKKTPLPATLDDPPAYPGFDKNKVMKNKTARKRNNGPEDFSAVNKK